MNTNLKKWGYILCLMLAALPVTSFADSQFFFVARQAAAGSITAAGQNQQVVYLRWGVVEGKLPADVTELRLLRNGVQVAATDWPANGVMSVSEINNLYQGAEQQRRKLETINRLNELTASQGESFSAGGFASYLRGLLDPLSPAYNPFWAFLGARTDFNIARARYRGWIDTNPVSSNGKVDYELLAVNSVADTTAVLGKASVVLGDSSNLLGATNLRQVLNSDTRCDMPENAKDHYTVALNWDSPGDEENNQVITDRVATQFIISGFDLYRTGDNLAPTVTQAPLRDIASLAAVVSTDSRGNPQINGLQKVNGSLVIDPGATTDEPKWLEARDLLQRAGLKPGDRRAYYLVPRDFTGNYGPTVATIVKVPQMTRPPAPWNIRTFADQSSSKLYTNRPDALSLTWDAVNLDNYLRMFQDTCQYCNTLEAQQTGILEFVATGKSCDTDVRNSVRLDVATHDITAYRIYRFVDFDVAGRFKDSDGDGFSDSDEIVDINNDGKIEETERAQGLQCDASQHPPVVAGRPHNYLLTPSDQELLFAGGLTADDPELVRLRDSTPAILKDTVLWYRIASVAGTADENGRLSFLSAPQRGLFPDRTPPPEPLVEVTKPGTVPVGCELKTVAGGPWSFTDERAVSDKEKDFTVSCASGSFYDDGVATSTSSQCGAATAVCASTSNATLSFPATAATGNVACNVTLPDDIYFCNAGSVSVVPAYQPVPQQPGDLVDGGVTVNVIPPNNTTCIALFETIDGTSTRVASTCDAGGFSYRPGKGQFCGYAIASDQNNNISATVQIPCTLAPSSPKPPGPPQILSFEVDETQAHFTFRLPAEQVAVTMARLDHEPGDGTSHRKLKSIAVINNSPAEEVSYSLAVENLLQSKDRFCLELQAIAPSAGTQQPLRSPWSIQRCYSRLAGGVEDLPVYMPWPVVNPPPKGNLLNAALYEYRSFPALLSLFMVNDNSLLNLCERILPDQVAGNPPPDPATPEAEYTDFDALECTDAGMAAVKAALAPQLNFILYRQSRISNGTESNWVQVSPLIEYAHFDDIPARKREDKDALSPIEWRLNDPFVKIIYNDTPADTLQFILLDHYPFALYADVNEAQSYQYRYQAVYFGQDQRPLRWRQSDWISGQVNQ